jgi:hypothetical protein
VGVIDGGNSWKFDQLNNLYLKILLFIFENVLWLLFVENRYIKTERLEEREKESRRETEGDGERRRDTKKERARERERERERETDREIRRYTKREIEKTKKK